MKLPPLRQGTQATEDLLTRRARMPSAWTPEMLEPGTVARDVAIGGVGCLVCEGETAAGTILYFHGGGYRMGSAAAYANFGTRLAAITGCRVVVVEYRLAPEHPFPAGLTDALAVYSALVAEDGRPPIVGGDSAGGGMAAAVALAAEPKPAKTVLLSPWVDLTVTNVTYDSRPGDQFFPRASAAEAAQQYLQGHSPEDALASPLKGDLSDYPPTLILASADECLIGDALAFQAALAEARRPVETHIVPAMTHVWPVIAPALPESSAAMKAIANFVRS
ncbi:MAG TPA: alpha/beta hydrolase fold domain-containing protein [Alphaproteobacteria bacterium]|nr:alpha/beta hydrolase fold domain-containing protein [Alphaproteobacteria bacterium]